MEQTLARLPKSVNVIFYVLGIATLLPWNFFITAESYWQYKLRNITLGEEWDAPEVKLTSLQVSFTPTLVIVSNTFATIFFFFNTFIVRRVKERVRFLGALSLSLVSMGVITLFSILDSDSWQTAFFVVTMIVVAFLNSTMAVVQGSTSGLAGLFPSGVMTSLMSGQAIAGVFSSLARIVSLLLGDDPIRSGIIYFSIADAFLMFTIASYIYLTRMNYYKNVKEKLKSETRPEFNQSRDWGVLVAVLKKIWPLGTSLGLTLLITLSVFPAVVVYITSSLEPSRWTDTFFQPTITFLLFNVADWLGREVCRLVQWPGPRGWPLHAVNAARLLFVPLLMLCHGDDKNFPTLFYSDTAYAILNLLFGFTNGYMINIFFVYYPQRVAADEQEMGGAIMVAMLGVGIVLGSLLSPAFVALWGPL